MPEFVPVAKVSDVPDPGKLTIEVDDQIVVLIHVGGIFYCIDDVCTHDGGPLGEGELYGCQIICPRHGARFDVRSGEALTMPATQHTRTHEVRVDGGTVSVKLSG
jgi:3-phenylpropionate/trans-cinnamate dioxygenase ferredoxin subunit